MAQSAVQNFYRYHAYIYDSTRWMILHGRRLAVDQLALQPDSHVLEIGCGTGLNFSYVLPRLDPARGSITGIDFSRDMLVRAQQRCTRHGWKNITTIEADATTLQLGRTFDAVFFAYSLTMIPDWRASLLRAWEHLRVGGRLVVLDFGRFQSWGPLAPLMRAWLRSSHVETLAPYADGIRDLGGEFKLLHWFGGYSFIAAARRTH